MNNSCDLLEKSYFCSIANNLPLRMSIRPPVVICLKNRTFAVSQTTRAERGMCADALWFAWKIVLLQYRKQLWKVKADRPIRCDLLEKSYFCSIANNSKIFWLVLAELWFAWKIVLLQYRKQPWHILGYVSMRCDLLEKSYFCSIANNSKSTRNTFGHVVICLKNRTFAVSQTTALIFTLGS